MAHGAGPGAPKCSHGMSETVYGETDCRKQNSVKVSYGNASMWHTILTPRNGA